MRKAWIHSSFEWVDNVLRHGGALSPPLWVRDLLRRPYHALLRLNPYGYALNLGRVVEARVPPEFCSKLMEEYEQDEFARIVDWCRSNVGGLFVDVGCSHGYMSCAALFSNPRLEVVAIDSDLQSLKITGRVCAYAPGNRLHVLQAMVSDEAGSQPMCWRKAVAETEIALADPLLTGNPGTHQYLNLDNPRAAAIPRRQLDDLLAEERASGRPVLVKCDVEGAEYVVLAGALETMRVLRMPILLSVHPAKMQRMGHSVEELQILLRQAGYQYEEFAVDHEHHWLCTARPA